MFGFNRKKQQTLLKYLFLRIIYLEEKQAHLDVFIRRNVGEYEKEVVDDIQDFWKNRLEMIHDALVTEDHATIDHCFAESERKRADME